MCVKKKAGYPEQADLDNDLSIRNADENAPNAMPVNLDAIKSKTSQFPPSKRQKIASG